VKNMPDKNDIQRELDRLGNLIKAKITLNLPALRIFKTRGYFDVVGGNWFIPDNQAELASVFAKHIMLSDLDRKLLTMH
jgi:hypothetical protein